MILGAQLARHRPEDARADGFALRIDEHGRIAVETDEAAIGTAYAFGGAHDENNEFKVGDIVWIEEHRPISKLKRWAVVRGEKKKAS